MSALLDWAGVIAGPVGVFLGSYGTYLFNRKVSQRVAEKHDAEAASTLTSAAVALVQPLQKQLQELRERVDTLEAENAQTKTRLQAAIAYIRELRAWVFSHLPDKIPPNPPPHLGL